MKGYCSVANIEDYILTEIDASFEDTIEEWIGQIEAYIEKKTGRIFIADEIATERWFDGNGETDMYIDEFVEITDVVIYDALGNVEYNLTKDTNYIEFPYNELPKRGLRVKYYNTIGFTYFPSGTKNIKVTAKWGYSVDVPELIKYATMVLTAGIINFSNKADGEVKSEKIGDYQVTYKDEAQWEDFKRANEIIDSFKKHDV
jgi:hypothetical protein